MREFSYIIDEISDGKDVFSYLKKIGYSRSIITSLKHDNRLNLNGEHIRTVDILRKGDTLTVRMDDCTEIVPNARLNAAVIYEDDDIVVFDKPFDMPVHPSIQHYDDTLANLFTARYPGVTFRSVSRLDRNTSGLILVAKNKLAAAQLSGNPKMRPKKLYYAVVSGDISEEFGLCGEIIAPIARENDSIINRVVRNDGKYAHTVFKVIKSSEKMSFLEISLVTGRTHQIRVHFSYKGYPLIGDDLYGGNRELIGRQALHCGSMTFEHPVTHKIVSVSSSPPEDMKKLIDMI